MKKLILLFLSFVLCFCAFGCSNSQEKSPEKTRINLGLLRLTSSAPLFIAMEKGYFTEQGLEVDIKWFDAAHPIAVATASSQIDVGATGITASLFNMAASGQNLAIVADKGREEKGYSSSALLVTADNYQNGIRTLADLKGKRIGITQKGSTFHYMLGRMLETQNLSLNDVEVIPLNKLSAVMAALESKQIDGAILNEPNITKVQNAGYGKLIAQVGDYIPYQTSAIFYSPEFLKNEAAGIKFMQAYAKACNYYYEAAVVKKDAQKTDEVIKIISKYVNAPAEDIRAGLPYIDKNGQLLKEDITTQINWYQANGMLNGQLTADKVVNTTFLDKALNK